MHSKYVNKIIERNEIVNDGTLLKKNYKQFYEYYQLRKISR